MEPNQPLSTVPAETENPDIHQLSLVEERVRALYKGTPLSIGVTIALDSLLSISHWGVIGHGELILWNTLMFCALTLRTANWFFWRNTRTNLSAEYWLNSFRVGALLGGAVWGSACYFMFADFNPTYQALLAFTLAGVASGSLSTLAIDKISVVGFVTFSTFPLSLRIFLEHGDTALPMSIMTLLFTTFVITASTRAREQLENNYTQNERLIQWGNERVRQQLITKLISDAQALFIAEADGYKTFEKVLADIVSISDSKLGFIGEVLFTTDQKPYLNMIAMSNVPWDKKSKAAYDKIPEEGMKFSNVNTLFGATLSTGRPIISNTPAYDMRAGGIPSGHPTIFTFIGIPIFHGTQLVAMLGLANKSEGYSDETITFLKPIEQLLAQFMIAVRHNRQHASDEEKLKRQAQHTQKILDEALDGIVSIDKYGKITSFNRAAEMIFGHRADQIIGENVSRLMPEPFRSQHDNYLHQHLVTGTHKIIGTTREVIAVRRNGKEFPLELSVSELIEEGERSYIGFLRDISDRKHTEKLKNEFIATVSHELRTPLTSISASLSIINSGTLGTLPEKVLSLIQIAKQNSLRLQNLINDLLDMDRLMGNRIEFNTSVFDANVMVQKAIDANKYYSDKYNVSVRISSTENNCKMVADETRTLQVMAHLLSNAAKFSIAHSAVEIAIAKKGGYIKVSVTDKGTGIPPEFKPNIFTSFSQADSSSTRHKDGSGLGLAISKELIEKMGGKIGFTSSLGQGSCFYFELLAAPSTNH